MHVNHKVQLILYKSSLKLKTLQSIMAGSTNLRDLWIIWDTNTENESKVQNSVSYEDGVRGLTTKWRSVEAGGNTWPLVKTKLVLEPSIVIQSISGLSLSWKCKCKLCICHHCHCPCWLKYWAKSIVDLGNQFCKTNSTQVDCRKTMWPYWKLHQEVSGPYMFVKLVLPE